MRILEFVSIIAFLLAASAGEESYGAALLLLALAGSCTILAGITPKRKKAKKCIRH